MSSEILILASQSPQRRELLAGLGIAFEVIPSTVSETDHPEADPANRARELSMLKARDVSQKNAGRWVLGADTLVVSPNGELLEKPNDAADARRMLQAQSGGTSIVHSAITLISPARKEWTDLSSSHVRFASLTPEMIDWWIEGGSWNGRSGGFQIDGPGQLLIEHIDGDWTSIVGLPVFLLGEMCRAAAAPFLP